MHPETERSGNVSQRRIMSYSNSSHGSFLNTSFFISSFLSVFLSLHSFKEGESLCLTFIVDQLVAYKTDSFIQVNKNYI